uniref:(California timema) hypothetical protein n=1 Tax=Timema californicum TaxID=61474 RepID=A0A7R9P9X2_TIMCA|nr:unnamed protein product [Timema californicum]
MFVHEIMNPSEDFLYGLPPPLDPSVTKPIVKLLVNQQHVFKTVAEKCDGFDHLECKYCQEKFSSDSQFQDHLLEETHKLRHLYRTNKKSLLSSEYKLTVCVNEDGKSLENVIVRPGTAGFARVNVANCSEEMKMLTDAIPLIIHSKVQVDCPHFPVEIKPGDTLHLSIVYCFEDSGAYIYPVLLKIQSQTSSEPVYVLKELVFRCQSEFVDDLKPISEYKYPIPPKLRVSEGPIIPGVPPSSATSLGVVHLDEVYYLRIHNYSRPMASLVLTDSFEKLPDRIIMKSSLVMVRRLDNYYIPPYLDKVLNNGLKLHPKMSSAEVKKLNEVNLEAKRDEARTSDPVICSDMLHRVLLGVDDVKEGLKARKCNLSANNYCDLFSLLLHIEEHQMKIDIHTFDCDNQILKTIPGEHNLLALKVPGLAENRPSVLRGDAIYVEILGDENHLRYEGIVHRVRENDVHLGFHKNFITKYVKGMQLRVQFTFNRLPLRVQHRALSMLRRCEVQKLMFPSIFRGLFGVSPITKWFNRDVSTNQQQMTAVTNIVFESASPAPYIVFGPPGTGKTVTMVEAIVQVNCFV